MKLREERVEIPGVDGVIPATTVSPTGPAPRRTVVYYTDIFQRTESTLRTVRQLASAGFAVCVPDLYPRAYADVALEFDDAGKTAGLAGAAQTTTGQFDADREAVIDFVAAEADEVDVVGFCLGGHLAFRAAFDDRVAATVCFYPTGLHDGHLGSDRADSLERAAEIDGRLMIIFGSNDPHVPAPARLQTVQALYAAGLDHTELHVYAGGEHAFMRDVGPRHDPVLTDLALTEAISFLRGR